ncbi:MAG: tetratricopeptide repeat protein [Chloroflexota bacterium]|nr:tetratricopeptide repeat protein [Chloroflexota bacterium]
MARARELRPRTRTQIDTLRDNLKELERSLPVLEGMGRRAVELLKRLDAVHDDMARLQEQGIDLRPEQTRWRFIEERLRGDRAPALAREVANTVGWEDARSSVAPGRDRWWWYLDEELARRRRAKLRSWLLRGGIAVAILALLAGAYQLFLAPSPEAKQQITLMQNAEQYVEKGDLDQAITSYEEARSVAPDDLELQLWLGVLYDQVDRDKEAERAFERAREISSSKVKYLLGRTQIYLKLGMLKEAERDALEALESDPNSAQALFFLGNVREMEGKYWEAIFLFKRAADEAEDPALQVLAKMRYGMLLQAGPSMEMRTTTTPQAE